MEVRRVQLAPDPAAPRQARQVAHDVLDGRISSWEQGDVDVVVTELVANAVLHGAPPIELVLATSGSTLRIEVCDGAPSAPASPAEHAPRSVEGGWGMLLVERLAGGWGVVQRPPGKCVWTEFQLPLS